MRDMSKTLLNATQLGKYCGVTRQRIHQSVREGKFKPDMVCGRILLFSVSTAEKVKAQYFSK